MSRNFMAMLEDKWKEEKYVCVGLDSSDLSRMTQIIVLTRDIACAYKPNLAFWIAKGEQGIANLRSLIDGIRKNSGVPIILDCKDADIDNTNNGYVEMIEYLGADAMTTNPYLGGEALMPFLSRKNMGVFVLCRTSNKGAGEFQDLEVGKNAFGRAMKLYEWVAQQVDTRWNTNGNCGLVTGATYPKELADIRGYCPEIPLLIPGIGAQGGDLEATVKAARHRFIINSSRGIINATDPRAETQRLHDEITQHLKGAAS